MMTWCADGGDYMADCLAFDSDDIRKINCNRLTITIETVLSTSKQKLADAASHFPDPIEA